MDFINTYAVDVFTLEGQFIGNWASKMNATKDLGIKSICNIGSCLSGKRPNAQGYIWKYHPTKVDILEGEIWKPAVGFENLYAVSNFGRVASTQFHGKRSFSIMKQSTMPLNYKTVKLRDWKKGYVKSYPVHRLVAETFLPNPENKPQVDHIDTNPANNRIDNLRWVTNLENQRNPLTLKHLQSAITLHNKSAAHKIEIQESLGHPILQYDRQGNFLQEFPSMSEAAKVLGTTACCIKRVCDGERTYHRTWKFKYKEQKTTGNT